MALHRQEQQIGVPQKRREPSWLLWTIIAFLTIMLLAFVLFALWIVLKLNIAQAVSVFTIISVLFTVLATCIGWIVHLIRQYYTSTDNIAASSVNITHPEDGGQRLLRQEIAPVRETGDMQKPKHAMQQEAKASASVDAGKVPHFDHVYGRSTELLQLKQWVVSDRCRVVAVVGIGGIGKTTLVAALIEQVHGDFDHILWHSLQNAPPLKHLVIDSVQFISDQQGSALPEEADGQISLLLDSLRSKRCLLVLDNVETILQTGDHAGSYREGYEEYGVLIQRLGESQHQSCLLLTSREKPKEVARLEGIMSSLHSFSLQGLRPTAGQQLLENKGISVPSEICARLIDLYSGNPLALTLVAEPIREVFGGDVAAFLKGGALVVGSIDELLQQQFVRLSPFEREIMYWLAIEREGISLDELHADIVRPIAEGTFLEALQWLRRRSLIEVHERGTFLLQPVILEYVTDCFVAQVCGEIDSGQVGLLEQHALIKAISKDYVRESQMRMILKPVTEWLIANFGKAGSEYKLKDILTTLHDMPILPKGYAAGNVLNLMVQLNIDLHGYDFSHLVVRQAYLQGISLVDINFAHANLATSTFTETFGSILSVAFSPDGELLAAGTTTGEIWIWQAVNGTPTLTFQAHIDWIRSIAFSPDGKILASAGEDQTIRLWDVSTGYCLRILRGHTDRVYSVAFSPDGKLLASGGDDRVIRLWGVSSGDCLHMLEGHTDRVYSVAFSLSRGLLASCGDDRSLRLWRTSTGDFVRGFYGHTHRVWSVAFSPDGFLLGSGSVDLSVRLWKVDTGECYCILQGHTEQIWSVAFSPDGKFLASGSEDQTIRLWKLDSGNCEKTLRGHTSWIRSVAFSPDSQVLASGGDDQSIRMWEVNTGYCLKTLQGYANLIRSVAFNPDGSLLASSGDDRTIRLWEVDTGRCLKTFTGNAHRVYSVAFSPDGHTLASGNDDQTIQLWDVSNGHCFKTFSGHDHWIRSVAFSPYGNLVSSCGDDQTVRLWEVDSGHCLKILQGHTHRVHSVTFSPDGKFVASAGGQEIRLWEVKTGLYLKTFREPTSWLWSVAFSPNGQTIVSGSRDQTIQIWNVSNGQCLRRLQGHKGPIWSVKFHPDGSTIASGSVDETIKIWDVQTGECRKTFRGERLYERMDITRATGLTEAQKIMLKTLGAVEHE